MKRLNLLFAVVIAAMSVCAIVVASASAAAPCKELKGAYCIVVAGNLYLLVLANVTGSSSLKLLNAEGTKEIITISCSSFTFKSHLEELETGLDIENITPGIVFSGCTVVGHAACHVTGPSGGTNGTITTFGITATYSEGKAGTAGDILFSAELASGEFAEIVVSECEQASIIHVKGKQLCSAPKPEEEVEAHEVTCTEAGSELTNAEKPVDFSATAKLALASGQQEEGTEETLTGKKFGLLGDWF